MNILASEISFGGFFLSGKVILEDLFVLIPNDKVNVEQILKMQC
jgi:hypothetical protein